MISENTLRSGRPISTYRSCLTLHRNGLNSFASAGADMMQGDPLKYKAIHPTMVRCLQTRTGIYTSALHVQLCPSCSACTHSPLSLWTFCSR